jgi:1-acyl-sn-glycerol-3-phosphate acyltransferase
MTTPVTEAIGSGITTDTLSRPASHVHRVAIVAADRSLAELISAYLLENNAATESQVFEAKAFSAGSFGPVDSVLYLPSLDKFGAAPDLSEAAAFFAACKLNEVSRCVLVSSAAVYGASFRNSGLAREASPLPKNNQGVAAQWKALEDSAKKHFQSGGELLVLRCTPVLSPGLASPLVRSLSGRTAAVVAGFDPTIQLLAPGDLAQAVSCVLRQKTTGIFNVAPSAAIPLRKALRLSGVRRIPLPKTLLRAAHLFRPGISREHEDFQQYPWTVSGEKIATLGFAPQKSSAEALVEFSRTLGKEKNSAMPDHPGVFDDFGMDKAYIDAKGRSLFRFLSDRYWRIDVAGTEYLPRTGKGILVGVHRGFMPFDGVMALHLLVRHANRYPRFLIHPSLVKFPFLADFMTKLGGILACQQNADHVLERDELLGVFPEGIEGAFVLYSKAYEILPFRRDIFVRLALRHRAPIFPFVTVGSAEIFPIFFKFKSRAWTSFLEWPAFPITPTFPLLPIPLPSKWSTRFLPPMHVEEEYPPSAADNPEIVRRISQEVRIRMQVAINEMLQQRRSIFFASALAAGEK